MYKHIHSIFLCIVLLLASSQTKAQVKCTTIGREFWVMFLHNGGDSSIQQTTLTAVGDSAATITVTNTTTGWSTTATKEAEGAVTIVVPLASSTDAQSKGEGLLVTSTEDISLYANNYKPGSSDATLVLPTTALGTRYMMQDYKGANAHSSTSSAEVGFVATRDSTVLTMVLPCNLKDNTARAGDTLRVRLMRGESYQLMAAAPGSFSGMEVTSGRKVFAAFQGNTLAYIPYTATGASTIYEQAIPVENWDTLYIHYTVVGRQTDQLLITSLEDSCEVSFAGTIISSLQRGETTEIGVTGGNPSPGTANFFHFSKNVCVGQYTVSKSAGGVSTNPGNPSSVILAPVDQGLQHIRFCALPTPGITDHYLVVVADTAYIAGITLDGNDISGRFQMIYDSIYGYVHVPIQAGVHVLESPLGPVSTSYYGLGADAAQSYILGRAFPNPTQPMIHRDTTVISDSVCQGESYSGNGFSVDSGRTAEPGTVTEWRMTEENDTVVHDFCLRLTVLPPSSSEVIHVIGDGDTLYYGGDTLTIAGVYHYTFSGANGCDSVVTLVVKKVVDGGSSDTTLTEPMDIHPMWFPNVFIPGDDANGTFGCHASCEFETYELKVFDRQGLEVWSTTDAVERWDGTRKGSPCPQAAYTYVLFYRTKDNPSRHQKKVGTVLLLR
ncbi:MAG: gliding motility-associated C-terminal domain-containing protein [Bacteroidales bacterium]|nr:gliding motility-associated C-terminal domain-containing protein [Bacteroidales bacterium]